MLRVSFLAPVFEVLTVGLLGVLMRWCELLMESSRAEKHPGISDIERSCRLGGPNPR
jgi:hypothetical protein